MMDWLNVLSDLPKDAISQACDGYLRDQPRVRPTPAEIRQRAHGWLKAKGRISAPRLGSDDDKRLALPKPERTQEEREEGQRIMDRAGFTPKRLDAVRRKRMARDEAELYAADNAERPAHWTETAAPDDPRWEALEKARADNPLIREARERQHAQRMMDEEKSA